ncbi:helix-turn-helix domain-containing protein [Yoonia vestfoldensis]|uniref:Helix-turn-helix domain protein n=1 Tax=Yoonia vestfoldensis TaxID=245188 RepID=A0A1Y0EE50_9RHOB|nr:helix-turn-helix transcriptional regulator [Yoonia vestfoldensis]ARU01689.1 helix-turn-helix domain protein [Yoonia vestfoldensis]
MSSRTDEMKISIVLRAARSGLGISQADLAAELDVSQSTITRCERGTGSFPANVLLRAISFFRAHDIDIAGILENNPTIVFNSRMFETLHDKESTRQRDLAASAIEKRFGKSKTVPDGADD